MIWLWSLLCVNMYESWALSSTVSDIPALCTLPGEPCPSKLCPLLKPKSASSAPHFLMGMCSLASWIFKSTSNSACLCVFSSPGASVLQLTELSIPRPCSLTLLLLWLWTCVEDPPSRFLCYCCRVLHLGFQMALLQDIPLSEKFLSLPSLPELLHTQMYAKWCNGHSCSYLQDPHSKGHLFHADLISVRHLTLFSLFALLLKRSENPAGSIARLFHS